MCGDGKQTLFPGAFDLQLERHVLVLAHEVGGSRCTKAIACGDARFQYRARVGFLFSLQLWE